MFLFIQGFKWAGWLSRHFNTSHVLIYPGVQMGWLASQAFQYISCSYLSARARLCRHHSSKFQYISCSYLSDLLLTRLMLTITFQYISCSYLSTTTSTCTLPTTISIHLMFLFIRVTELHLICNPLFQYISCSYLSWSMR